MTLLQETRPDTTHSVVLARDAAGLEAFLHPASAAAIWQRHMPDTVRAWLDMLDPGLLPNGRVIVAPHAVRQTVGHLCDISGLPAGSERDWLQTDITALAKTFARLMSPRFLRLRLDVVTTNACRRFHIDAITARLVCTYRGTGTQYGVSEGGADPSHVFSVATGAPILLRGTRWPPEPDPGLLHRSPPIEGTGETRLLLVLDPVTDPDDDL